MSFTYFYTLHHVVAPTLTESPSKQTITEGSKVTFHCTASSNPAPEIKWVKDDAVVGEGETLTFHALRNRSGEYWCIADNGLNDTANASAYLDVHCKYDWRCRFRYKKNGDSGWNDMVFNPFRIK